jgi:hypothetical protein
MTTTTIYPSGDANNAAVATGTITCVAKANLVDGDKVTLTNSAGYATTYEFKVTSSYVVTAGNVEVDISSGVTTAAEVATALARVIVLPTPAQVSIFGGSGYDAAAAAAVVTVTQSAVGTAGNTTIVEAVADAGFTVTNFTGGVDGPSTDLTTLINAIAAASNDDILLMKSYAEGVPATPVDWILGNVAPTLADVPLEREGIPVASPAPYLTRTATGVIWYPAGLSRGEVRIGKRLTIRGDVDGGGLPITVIKDEAAFDASGWAADLSDPSSPPVPGTSSLHFRYQTADVPWLIHSHRAKIENLFFDGSSARIDLMHPADLTNVKFKDGPGYHVHGLAHENSVYPYLSENDPDNFSDPLISTIDGCVTENCVSSVETFMGDMVFTNCTFGQGKTDMHPNVRPSTPNTAWGNGTNAHNVIFNGCTITTAPPAGWDSVNFDNVWGGPRDHGRMRNCRVIGCSVTGGSQYGLSWTSHGAAVENYGLEMRGNTVTGSVFESMALWGTPVAPLEHLVLAAQASIATSIWAGRSQVFCRFCTDGFLSRNDYTAAPNPGKPAAGGHWSGGVLLMGRCSNMVVHDDGGYPTNGASHHVSDFGGFNNRVVGFPSNNIIDPGIGQLVSDLRSQRGAAFSAKY